MSNDQGQILKLPGFNVNPQYVRNYESESDNMQDRIVPATTELGQRLDQLQQRNNQEMGKSSDLIKSLLGK